MSSSMQLLAASAVPQLRAPSAVSLLEKVLQKQTYVLVGVANYSTTYFTDHTSTQALLCRLHACESVQLPGLMIPLPVPPHLLESCSAALQC